MTAPDGQGSARSWSLPVGYDLPGSMTVLAFGRVDPTIRINSDEVWWATHTPDGPATLHLHRRGIPAPSSELVATGYGPGAGWVLERADAVAGLRDDLTGFAALAAQHPRVARLAREHRGLRLPTAGRVWQFLAPTILGQKVTVIEARRGYAGLVRQLGEPAPGPITDLLLPPDPATVAATPYWAFHRHGVEQRRADTLRRAAALAASLEAAPDAATLSRRLLAIPGVGPWTAAEVTRLAFGDPDVVTVGDYHIPNSIAWALAGEARGDDARMLELLAPFAGHRGRVCRLIAAAGIGAPKFGPRTPIRSFARF